MTKEVTVDWSRKLALVFIALVAGGCVKMQPFVPLPRAANATAVENELQQIVDEAVNDLALPGVQAGVRMPDGRRLVVASGTRDPGRRSTRIGTRDVFRIGSTTKMFVAALIGRLQDKGLLSFDDRLSKWVPELPDVGETTLRQLLNHTSGIPADARSGLPAATKWPLVAGAVPR